VSTPLAPAGWHPDPTGRYEFRYFNGHQWTADVSVHGQRFIDGGGPPTWQPGWGPEPPSTSRRTRGTAVAAFVVGLISLLLAWIPFVFVLGGAGAITAFVLGIIGVQRATRNEGHGRGYAVAGIVLSVLALGVCVAGFFFTRFVLREVNAYLDPGPHGEPRITTCFMSAETGLHMQGTILNLDGKAHRYEISMEYRFSDASTESEVISVPSVPSGGTGEFTSHLTVVKAGSVTCKVTSVYGPAPFGASSG
jgi:hypothetical protein